MNDIKIDTLGYFVDRTFTGMVKYLNYELKNHGLDIQHPHFTIMMVLSRNEGINQSTLASYVDRDKASVSRHLNYLEEKGYIERKFDGGCKNFIYLTEKGKGLVPILYKISELDTEKTLKGFPPKKQEDIYRLLTKMYLNISTAIPAANPIDANINI